LLKQLESKPFDFGSAENKVTKILESSQNRRELKQLGISLVHTLKKEKRVPVNYLRQLVGKSNSLRKDMSNVRNLRKR
jgi:hypothetical protein